MAYASSGHPGDGSAYGRMIRCAPDRCLVWNEHALREYEHFYNQHRAHQALNQAAPLRTVPDPITDPERITDLNVRRRDRLGGVLHEYSQAA